MLAERIAEGCPQDGSRVFTGEIVRCYGHDSTAVFSHVPQQL